MVRRRTRQQLEAATGDDRASLIEALAKEAHAGDEQACADLAWAILRFGLARPALRRYLIGDADVQVAEQATVVAVALRLPSWRAEAKFTTWLHQVATNEARQLIRAESRHATAPMPLEDEVGSSDGFIRRVSSMIADEAAVQKAIAALPAAHRQAIELREYAGLTYDEIATRLDIPINTVKTHLRRARTEVARELAGAYT